MLLSQARTLLRETDRDTLTDLIERFGEELVIEYCENGYCLGDMEEAYQGKWRDDEEFVQDLVKSEDLPPYIAIDWEHTARDIMMDYFDIDGHYFRLM